MKKRQQGFSHVIIVLLIIVMALVGFAGWRVWKQNKSPQDDNAQTQESSEQNIAQVAEKKIFHDENQGFTLEYPDNWKLEEETVEDQYSVTEGRYKKWSLESPGGLKIKGAGWVGGVGGACTPRSDLQEGEKSDCDNWSFLKLTKLDKANYSTDKDIYVAQVHSTGSDYAKKDDFQVVYYTTNKGTDQPQVNKTYEGISYFLMLIQSSKHSENMSFVIEPKGDDAAYFEREDVKQAEAILSSIKFE